MKHFMMIVVALCATVGQVGATRAATAPQAIDPNHVNVKLINNKGDLSSSVAAVRSANIAEHGEVSSDDNAHPLQSATLPDGLEDRIASTTPNAMFISPASEKERQSTSLPADASSFYQSRFPANLGVLHGNSRLLDAGDALLAVAVAVGLLLVYNVVFRQKGVPYSRTTIEVPEDEPLASGVSRTHLQRGLRLRDSMPGELVRINRDAAAAAGVQLTGLPLASGGASSGEMISVPAPVSRLPFMLADAVRHPGGRTRTMPEAASTSVEEGNVSTIGFLTSRSRALREDNMAVDSASYGGLPMRQHYFKSQYPMSQSGLNFPPAAE